MKIEHRIYYAIAGFTIFLGWMVAAGIIIHNAQSGEPLRWVDAILSKSYIYLVNWKLYALVCLIFGAKASILSHEDDLGLVVIFTITYMLISIALSFFNAVTLAFLPISTAYLALYFYREPNRLLIPASIGFFVLLAIIISLFTKENTFINHSFHDLVITKVTLTNLHKVYALLFKPAQLFGLTFGFFMLFLGYWIGQVKWFLEYHFLYNELKKLFKISVFLLALWILLNEINAYKYISQWQIGKLFFVLDGFAVQLISLFIYIFILIYFENFRWGLKLLRLLENAAKAWVYHTFGILTFLLFFTIYKVHIHFWLLAVIAFLLFYFLARFVRKSPKIHIP